MKTLTDSRNELLDYLQENGVSLENIKKVSKELEKQDKEFIKEILKEINEGIKLTIKFYKHKEGEELGAEIYNYLYKIIKNKLGFEE